MNKSILTEKGGVLLFLSMGVNYAVITVLPSKLINDLLVGMKWLVTVSLSFMMSGHLGGSVMIFELSEKRSDDDMEWALAVSNQAGKTVTAKRKNSVFTELGLRAEPFILPRVTIKATKGLSHDPVLGAKSWAFWDEALKTENRTSH